MIRVMKWNLTVDDAWHPLGVGKVVHVDNQFGGVDTLQVWTEEECAEPSGTLIHSPTRKMTVIGTGHAVPPLTEHLGSVLVADGRLIWHVYGSLR